MNLSIFFPRRSYCLFLLLSILGISNLSSLKAVVEQTLPIICNNEEASVELREDHTVWIHSLLEGSDTPDSQETYQLEQVGKVEELVSIKVGFAMVNDQGELYLLKNSSLDPSANHEQVERVELPAPVEQLVSNGKAVAALLKEDSFYVWGDPYWGGDEDGKLVTTASWKEVQPFSVPGSDGSDPLKGFMGIDQEGVLYRWGDPSVGEDGIATTPIPEKNFYLGRNGEIYTKPDQHHCSYFTFEQLEALNQGQKVQPEVINIPDYVISSYSKGSLAFVTKDNRLYVCGNNGYGLQGGFLTLPKIERFFSDGQVIFCYLADGRFYRWGETKSGEFFNFPIPIDTQSMIQQRDQLIIQIEGNRLLRIPFAEKKLEAHLDYLTMPELLWLHLINESLFLGMTPEGRLYACGESSYGGLEHGGIVDTPPLHDSCFHKKAIAGITDEQELYIWGDPQYGGAWKGKKVAIPPVTLSCENGKALFSLTKNHRCYVWGDPQYGGAFGEGKWLDIGNVIHAVTSHHAFAALTNLAKLYIWGDPQYGGAWAGKFLDLPPIFNAVTTQAALAGLTLEGKVYIWGNPKYGGTWGGKFLDLENIVSLIANKGAILAQDKEGKLYVWGNPQYGGSDSIEQIPLQNISSAVAADNGFVLLNSDGTLYHRYTTEQGKPILEQLLLPDKFSRPQHLLEADGVALGISDQGEVYPVFGSIEESIPPLKEYSLHKHSLAGQTADHRLYLWGEKKEGGLPQGQVVDIPPIKKIVKSEKAFAALTEDKRCYFSGDPLWGGIEGGGFVALPKGVLPKTIVGTKKGFFILGENGVIYQQIFSEEQDHWEWQPCAFYPNAHIIRLLEGADINNTDEQQLPGNPLIGQSNSVLAVLSDGSFEILGDPFIQPPPLISKDQYLAVYEGEDIPPFPPRDVMQEPMIQLFLKQLSLPKGTNILSVQEEANSFTQMFMIQYLHVGLIKIKLSNGEEESWLLTQNLAATHLRNVTDLKMEE